MRTISRVVIFVLIVCGVSILLTSLQSTNANADTWSAKTIGLDGQIDGSALTAPYMVLWDYNTGHLVHSTTGACTVAVTWANAVIRGTQHAESNRWTLTLPPLDDSKEYCFAVCDAAIGAEAKTDVTYRGGYLDPATGKTYGDEVISISGRAVVRQRN